jgi:hypothetical protein
MYRLAITRELGSLLSSSMTFTMPLCLSPTHLAAELRFFRGYLARPMFFQIAFQHSDDLLCDEHGLLQPG